MPMPLMLQPLFKYAVFDGRARRSEFWQFWLFRIVLTAGLVIGSLVFGHRGQIGAIVHLALGLASLALLLPEWAVAVRRLHDTNRTGWWLLLQPISLIIGLGGFLVTSWAKLVSWVGPMGRLGAMTPLSWIPYLGGFALWMFCATSLPALLIFIFNLSEGTAGPNRFGPDPKGRGDDQVAKTFS